MHILKTSSLVIWAACAAVAGPSSVPSPGDMTLLEAALAKELRDPASIMLTDVVASVDPLSSGNMTWMCGLVRGKNALGGYADPMPFMAMAVDDPLSDARDVQWSRIAETDHQVSLVETLCTEKFAFALAVSEADAQVVADLKHASDLELVCLVEGAATGACGEREELLVSLRERGFCDKAGGMSVC